MAWPVRPAGIRLPPAVTVPRPMMTPATRPAVPVTRVMPPVRGGVGPTLPKVAPVNVGGGGNTALAPADLQKAAHSIRTLGTAQRLASLLSRPKAL